MLKLDIIVGFQIKHGVDGGTRQLLVSKTFSTERKLGQNCKQSERPFKSLSRAVRERYTLLSEKFKAKIKDEEGAAELNPGEDAVENDKKKVDNAKAVEMTNRALEMVE